MRDLYGTSDEPSFKLYQSVLYDDRLKAVEKIIFSQIVGLSINPHATCFATNDYFAKSNQCTERYVQTCLKRLEELGYIRVVTHGSKRDINVSFKSNEYVLQKIK